MHAAPKPVDASPALSPGQRGFPRLETTADQRSPSSASLQTRQVVQPLPTCIPRRKDIRP
eukprot:scaffold5766_cov256-Pinguiococcus_pyrenoidosus.AAC.12